MPPIRIIASYFLWKARLQKCLPAFYIRRIPVCDCNEKLVPLRETSAVKLDSRFCEKHLLRETAARLLLTASESLPEGYMLVVVESYRNRKRQIECWNRERSIIAGKNPLMDKAEIDRRTRLIIADPTTGKFGGHQTGAAVDVTLADSDGHELFMGTRVQEFSSRTPSSKAPDIETKHRRDILSSVMKSAGFVNYPGEWWHFSYGDQLWAAYSNRKSAIYGFIDD